VPAFIRQVTSEEFDLRGVFEPNRQRSAKLNRNGWTPIKLLEFPRPREKFSAGIGRPVVRGGPFELNAVKPADFFIGSRRYAVFAFFLFRDGWKQVARSSGDAQATDYSRQFLAEIFTFSDQRDGAG